MTDKLKFKIGSSRCCVKCDREIIERNGLKSERKRASFNLPTETKAKYCEKHKTDEMVNMNRNTCIGVNDNGKKCTTTAQFNVEGQPPRYCSQHADKKTMINIANRKGKCQGVDKNGEPCKRIYPVYNFPSEKKPIYCKEHKLEGMVNLKSEKRQCAFDGCTKTPQYSDNKDNKDLEKMYCKLHCQQIFGVTVRVYSEGCEFKGCTIERPCYNFIGENKGRFCVEHKIDGMIDISSARCKQEGCDKQPTYNYSEFKYGVYCVSHCKPGMENVTGKKCIGEGCYTIPYYHNRQKYKGYCLRCFIRTFPDEPISKNYKTKELAVVDFVKHAFPDWTYSCDKKVQDGCSRRRPDIFVDFGEYVIVVEIDEGEHCKYDSSCENKRLMELSQDIAHRPMVIIRFNPDDYKIQNKKIRSCWSFNKLGIAIVADEIQWHKRLIVLKETIDKYSKMGTEKTIEVVHLFYSDS
jgi:hypothetical protein